MLAIPETKSPQLRAVAIAVADHYRVTQAQGRWMIERLRDGHAICIARSHMEACALAKTLNKDYLKDPRHHALERGLG
jgi:hypothetical protein